MKSHHTMPSSSLSVTSNLVYIVMRSALSTFLIISTCSTTTTVFSSSLASTPSVVTAASTSSSSKQQEHQKQILLEEIFTTSLSPIESRDYMLHRPNWLRIVPNCDQGSIEHHDDKYDGDGAEVTLTKRQQRGAWTITTNNGDEILCSDTVFSDRRRRDRFAAVDDHGNNSNVGDNDDGCFLSYNVFVNMHKEGVSFTFDIEYDILEGQVRRQVHSFQPIGWKSKMVSPLIKSGLVELMQEENKRLTTVMNTDNPKNAKILYSTSHSSSSSSTKR
jgi:hypothetical protein